MSFLCITTLGLNISTLLITIPKIPVPQSIRRYTKSFPVFRLVIYGMSVGLVALESKEMGRVLSDVVMVLVFGSGFIVPGEFPHFL